MAKLDFELVTPYRQVFRLEVDEVVCPGVEGEFGVLPGHAPLLAVLKIGVLGFRRGSEWRYVAIAWGYCEVANDRVSVMAETAEPAEEIDPARAAAARDQAEARLKALSPGTDEYAQAMTELEKALARLQTVAWRS
ncbi:MAG TPA: F0F1 ATP synthase subunit epsilon [Thermodesulfobacteriota bacterium]|nr:F0F1 ATP synthase subunit epsilon [Thermodesulfobacteriota bacterium]